MRHTLGLTGLEEDVRNNLVDLADKLEHGVIGKVLEGEFTLSSVTRVLRGLLGWCYVVSMNLRSCEGRRGRNRGRPVHP